MASSRKLPDIVGVVATRNSLNRPKILHHAGFETKQVDSGKNVLVLWPKADHRKATSYLA